MTNPIEAFQHWHAVRSLFGAATWKGAENEECHNNNTSRTHDIDDLHHFNGARWIQRGNK